MDDVFVGQLMTSPALTERTDATLRDAAERMDAAGIGSLVVVDDDGIAGILTRTDFVRAAAEGRDPATTPVSAFATELVETTTGGVSVSEAAEQMVASGVHHLPVVDPDEGLIGMLTSSDLTAYVSEA